MALLAIVAGGVVSYHGYQDTTNAQAATTYPNHIINGDFEYPPKLGGSNTTWVVIVPQLGHWTHNSVSTTTAISNWNRNSFAWNSTQYFAVNSGEQYTNGVEMQVDINGNQYAELVASQAGTSIYQDIQTTPNTVYRWKLDHTSLVNSHVDSMQVTIDAPNASSPKVQDNIRRTQSNGIDGGIGNVSNLIATPSKSSDSRNHSSSWATYEGQYLVPAGQTTTRFSFKSYSGYSSTGGNLLDNISFQIAYPLYYNLNGGSSNVDFAPTANNYSGYYTASQSITLSAVEPTREGYTFIGWSNTQLSDATNKFTYDENKSKIVSSITMESPSKTVYAVWAKNPVLTFKDQVTGNIVKEIEIPFSSTISSDDIPESPAHDYYDFTGYDDPTKLTSPIYEDTIITLNYSRNDLISLPASIEWHDKDNYAGIRPETVTLSLYTDGIKMDTKTLTSADNWECTFDNLPAHADDGHLYEYKIIREDNSGIPSEYTIADTLIPQEGTNAVGLAVNASYVKTISIPVTKVWDDMNDVYKERPNTVTITLDNMENGEWMPYANITLSPEASKEKDQTSWQAAFTDIPLWDADTEEMLEWRIEEVKVYGYDLVSLEANGDELEDGFTLTNRIWKHIEMPGTGENGNGWMWMISVVLIITSFTTATFWQRKR